MRNVLRVQLFRGPKKRLMCLVSRNLHVKVDALQVVEDKR